MMDTIRARFRTRFGAAFSLDIEMTVPARGVTALFGHSGSGKTTTLRCVAGLERADGELHVGNDTWQDARRFLPVHRRPLAYVFQEASLFGHLSVRGNLDYGLRRTQAAGRWIGFDQAVDWLGLSHLLDRRPDQLSGGERQRVAIAAALLTSPRLLLMDEPLSALDHRSRDEILTYLEHLRDTLSIPILYVTHSPDEVVRLADHLVVLDGGRVATAGPASGLPARLGTPKPPDEAVVTVAAQVTGRDAALRIMRATFAGGSIWVDDTGAPIGDRIRLRMSAGGIGVSRDGNDTSGGFDALPDDASDARPTGIGQPAWADRTSRAAPG